MGPRAGEAGEAQADRSGAGTRPGAIAPAWARISVLAGLLVLVAYSVLFAPAIGRMPFMAGLPGWAGPLVAVVPPLAFATLLLVLLSNIAERAERHRRALIHTERRFRSAVEAARGGVWEWDLDTDRVWVSERMGRMLGLSAGGVISGEEMLACVAPDHRERMLKALKGAAVHGAFDVCFRAPGGDQGRPLWIDARGQAAGPRGEDGFGAIVGVALDVTDEQLAQARAQAAELRLRDAIESASEAFAVWDRTGRLLLSNENFRDWFGIDQRLLKPGAAYRDVMRATSSAIVREHQGERDGSREAETADGRWIQISERRTSDGGLVLTAADVTAIKRQEEARARNEAELEQLVARLRQHQAELAVLAREYESEKTRAEAANRSKSEFLANMSHELRTPLNAINGFSEIMAGEMFGPLGDARYKEYARDIFNSGQHLLALINDILDMAKIEAGKFSLRFSRVAVDEVVEDAVRLMRGRAESGGLDLDTSLQDLPLIEADQRALKQILLNLLSNAVKFTPRGGRITVSAERAGEHVRLTVKDTGIGISAQDLARLARPFEQVETQHAKTQQGTGLGLALTRSLIELHGGRLELSSEPGLGTSAAVALPIHRVGQGLPQQSAA